MDLVCLCLFLRQGLFISYPLLLIFHYHFHYNHNWSYNLIKAGAIKSSASEILLSFCLVLLIKLLLIKFMYFAYVSQYKLISSKALCSSLLRLAFCMFFFPYVSCSTKKSSETLN